MYIDVVSEVILSLGAMDYLVGNNFVECFVLTDREVLWQPQPLPLLLWPLSPPYLLPIDLNVLVIAVPLKKKGSTGLNI